jgi:dihydrolipoamide dehydrogenase
LTEDAARSDGNDVAAGRSDLAFNARAVALGGRGGLLKLVADRASGEILGVHAAGPGAGEIVAVAALAMQSELLVTDLAAMVQWHPAMAESLAEAARTVVR